MGDPAGFMNHKRKLGTDRDPALRIGDWSEFYRDTFRKRISLFKERDAWTAEFLSVKPER